MLAGANQSQQRMHCITYQCPAGKPDVYFDIAQGLCLCVASAEMAQEDNHGSSLEIGTHRGDYAIREQISKVLDAIDMWAVTYPNQWDSAQLRKVVDGALEKIDVLNKKISTKSSILLDKLQAVLPGASLHKRQESGPTTTFTSSTSDPVPTYVPPPKTDLTPELLNQSLASQPQKFATVTSVIPNFPEGVLTYLIQMEGIVAASIPMNASTSLACGMIGSTVEPYIMIVPKYVVDGQPQTTVADCMVIAVNMYSPQVITYWIQNMDGEIFSLVGSNQVHDIDQINTAQPIALSLRASQDSAKRSTDSIVPVSAPRFRWLYAIDCRATCHNATEFIQGFQDYCGCIASDTVSSMTVRGLSEPQVGEAKMTAEACAAMTCINNGGSKAMFNPFSLTCWCPDPARIEDNPSGWSGKVRARLVSIFT